MNKINRTLIQIFCVLGAVFLTINLIVWTIIPYSQMWSLFTAIKKSLNEANFELLMKTPRVFSPMTYVQPTMRYYLLNFIINIYEGGDNVMEKEKVFANKTLTFAVDRMEEAILYEPNYASSILTLGRAYDLIASLNPEKAKEFHQKAVEQYDRSLKIYPNNQKTLYAYAINLSNQGKIDEAVTIIKKVFEDDKRVPDSAYYLGAILYMKDNYANSNIALEYIERALDNNTNLIPALTKTIYQRMLKQYYSAGDIDHLKTVIKRLTFLDLTQATAYEQIYSYIVQNNALPIINLK